MKKIFLTIALILVSLSSFAEREVALIRRLAVFPLNGVNGDSAEDAWWQSREVLTKDQRFFVASRRLMINRGAFQSRKNLKPADVIILGKILDAQGLVVFGLEDRNLKMKVYETENGQLYYETKLDLHPAIPVSEQIVKSTVRLSNQFIRSQPFHGFVIASEDNDSLIQEKNQKKVVTVFKGSFELGDGDDAQFVRAINNSEDSLLGPTIKIEVFAEGKVIGQVDDKVQIEITRTTDLNSIKDQTMVRFPRLMKQSKDDVLLGDKDSNLTAEYLSSEMKDVHEFSKGHGPTASSLAWIFNLAVLVLLAF